MPSKWRPKQHQARWEDEGVVLGDAVEMAAEATSSILFILSPKLGDAVEMAAEATTTVKRWRE